MLNDTQIKQVKEQLEKNGWVSRNWALQRYISRLGAIIHILKKEGYEFETSYKDAPNGGKDYVYCVKKEEQQKLL